MENNALLCVGPSTQVRSGCVPHRPPREASAGCTSPPEYVRATHRHDTRKRTSIYIPVKRDGKRKWRLGDDIDVEGRNVECKRRAPRLLSVDDACIGAAMSIRRVSRVWQEWPAAQNWSILSLRAPISSSDLLSRRQGVEMLNNSKLSVAADSYYKTEHVFVNCSL